MFELRILRTYTRDIQPDGQFYIDTLQYTYGMLTPGLYIDRDGTPTTGTIEWKDVPIVEVEE